MINGLNAGASVYMADLEDSMTPGWHNVIDAQINLRDAVACTIKHVGASGKTYQLNAKTAVLLVRPRGWHMVEAPDRAGADDRVPDQPLLSGDEMIR